MPAMAPRPREVNRAGYKAYSLLPLLGVNAGTL